MPLVLLAAIPISIAVTLVMRHEVSASTETPSGAGAGLYIWTDVAFAVGGANAAIPEMQRIAVDMRHWITDKQFSDISAIS